MIAKQYIWWLEPLHTHLLNLRTMGPNRRVTNGPCERAEFLTLWDEMWPDFVEDSGVNRKGLTNAIIEKIGAGAYGMDYPFQDSERVENLPELLENWQK